MNNMTDEDKQFILNELIPFILREEGRGFGMSKLYLRRPPGTQVTVDDIKRVVPTCGTVCCIKGSIEVLKGLSSDFLLNHEDSEQIGALIGLDYERSWALFQRWRLEYDFLYQWPLKQRQAFAEAETPLAKAEIACEVLRLVVETGGACLD
jgi:hypothetical protein